jgi:cell division septation protein DedD
MWAVQVASYETLDQAQTLEQTLCEKGYAARIIGTNKPFTVQVGAYPSSDSAMIVARRLSSRELTVFVTQAKH